LKRYAFRLYLAAGGSFNGAVPEGGEFVVRGDDRGPRLTACLRDQFSARIALTRLGVVEGKYFRTNDANVGIGESAVSQHADKEFHLVAKGCHSPSPSR
jgi:hypothetical protein